MLSLAAVILGTAGATINWAHAEAAGHLASGSLGQAGYEEARRVLSGALMVATLVAALLVIIGSTTSSAPASARKLAVLRTEVHALRAELQDLRVKADRAEGEARALRAELWRASDRLAVQEGSHGR